LLPLLDWTAARSSEVAAEIVRRFDQVMKTSGNIEPRLGAGIQDIELLPSADDTRRVRILGAEGDINEIVDVAIIAIGFGQEPRSRLGVETPSYWADDDLEDMGGSPERPARVLVSGAGDGALIDLLRAKLYDFRHEDIVALLPEGEGLTQLVSKLQAIESEARRMSVVTDNRLLNLHGRYSQLSLPTELLDAVRKRLRNDTDVWFNFRSAGRYTLASSMLNRALVLVLCHLQAIRPKLASLNENSITRNSKGTYAVQWAESADPETFDRVVIRHGPASDYLIKVFPKLERACAPLSGKLADLDLTSRLDSATRDFFTA
jgi:hypothetical protein